MERWGYWTWFSVQALSMWIPVGQLLKLIQHCHFCRSGPIITHTEMTLWKQTHWTKTCHLESAHERHTLTEKKQIHSHCGPSFICLPVSNKKEVEDESKSFEHSGWEVERDASLDDINACRCVFERQPSLSNRGKVGLIEEVTRVSFSFLIFMDWWWYVYV